MGNQANTGAGSKQGTGTGKGNPGREGQPRRGTEPRKHRGKYRTQNTGEQEQELGRGTKKTLLPQGN